MSANEVTLNVNHDKALALRLLDLSALAVKAKTVEDLARNLILELMALIQPMAAFIYIANPGLSSPYFYQCGFEPQVVSKVKNLCITRYLQMNRPEQFRPSLMTADEQGLLSPLAFHPLQCNGECLGFIGIQQRHPGAHVFSAEWDILWELFLRLLADAFNKLIEQSKSLTQMKYFNTYLTVSSMLAHNPDLHELFETTLFCCMEELSCEAASIIFYSKNGDQLCFYHVEGAAAPSLTSVSFPAAKGIAGAVLQSQTPEIINDVQNDRRFLREIDSFSGFRTNNMIAVPLLAEDERVGVLEIVNKKQGAPFLNEEQFLPMLIAEEIAFAVRNAKIFELAVKSYCKQRQGQSSCRGCERPLGSWAPCLRYHSVDNQVLPLDSSLY